MPYGNHVGIGSFVLFFVVRQGVSGRRLRRAGLHLCVVGASMVAAVGKITQAGVLEGLLIEGEPESIENFRSDMGRWANYGLGFAILTCLL